MKLVVILLGAVLFCACSWVRAESTLVVGEVKVKASGQVIIPIGFENDGSVVGLQFDLFLPIDEIQNVDVGECFVKDVLSTNINACGQMKPPNHDVIRYLLVNSTLSPVPSGHLTDLVIDIKPNAFSGHYSLTISPNTALAISKDAGLLPLAFQNGK